MDQSQVLLLGITLLIFQVTQLELEYSVLFLQLIIRFKVLPTEAHK